ncbi:ABC transporter ATP-binding protein [Klugiella xanthotipulae]|uniref:Iron complex transport system ATP-binding protein n=1 Tax=Klugiella xanthotipulae TaxID=244735 RepID=A0A543HZ73_9MICO|nr:ABC transporter ATP-binding protein [Klugiella xanthotipulae]TQM63621.1 iron complex transport system ATP-binding protein [Klugiella xanthotipulae]
MSTPAVRSERTTPAPVLRAEGVRVGYDAAPVIPDLSVEIPEGRVTVIVGANACGKSTLLKTLARLLKPRAGRVMLDDRDIAAIPGRELARVVGLLPQHPEAPEGITVSDLVGRGRYPHQGWMRRWSAEDDRVVAEALSATETATLADRSVGELSGGQRQRVWIALALAQDPSILLLDEPTTFLDLAHQLDILDLLDTLNRTQGSTIVMVLHDLNLAARYADHLIVMAGGRIIAEGAPAAVITADTVREAFGLDCLVIADPVTGSPLVIPRGRLREGPTTP